MEAVDQDGYKWDGLKKLALSKGGKSQATGLSMYSRGNFISAGVDGIVNLFEEFFLLEGCGVGLYSLSFYNLSVGSPYARPKKKNTDNVE